MSTKAGDILVVESQTMRDRFAIVRIVKIAPRMHTVQTLTEEYDDEDCRRELIKVIEVTRENGTTAKRRIVWSDPHKRHINTIHEVNQDADLAALRFKLNRRVQELGEAERALRQDYFEDVARIVEDSA